MSQYRAASGMNAMKTPSMASNDNDPLPLGWEVKIDPQTGWPFFVNHNNRTTTWNDPRHDTKKVREVSTNGPSMDPSPQETQKNFVKEMKHPILRPGYVPIPVFHEGADLKQQQHPCYSYIQPTTAQSIRTEGQMPSPTTGLHCRPRSPLHGPGDNCSTGPGKAGSPVSQTAEVYTGPHTQPPRPSSTGLQAGYIPIPVIHEGGAGQMQAQPPLNQPIHSQRVPYSDHQQPFQRLQQEDWPGYCAAMQPPRERASPTLFPQHRDAAAIHLPHNRRSQSPIVTHVLAERPQPLVMREPPQRLETEQMSPQQKTESAQVSQPLCTDADGQKPPPQQHQHFQQPPPQHPQQFQQAPPQAPPQASPQPHQAEQLSQQAAKKPADVRVETPPHPEAHETAAAAADVTPVKVEAEQPPQCPVHPGLAKVQKIVERVAKLEQEVKCFEGKKNDKKYLLLEELLTKELLALDSVDPEGRADVRQARRDGVRRVQTILEELEQLEEPSTRPGSQASTEGDNMVTKENAEMAKEITE
uniref:BAG family molecular chaperone regulator 3 n=1 Tax=Doryrhamphus excisus TaxID=161450 RepID=UPI0025AE1343|nr:BAG family molecular chaperone regulator 3 [Doryrhamphus excisus]